MAEAKPQGPTVAPSPWLKGVCKASGRVNEKGLSSDRYLGMGVISLGFSHQNLYASHVGSICNTERERSLQKCWSLLTRQLR